MRGPFHSLSPSTKRGERERERLKKRGDTRVIRRPPWLPVSSFLLFLSRPSPLFALFSSVSIVSSPLPLLALWSDQPKITAGWVGAKSQRWACAAADFPVPSRIQCSVFSLFSSKPLPPPPPRGKSSTVCTGPYHPPSNPILRAADALPCWKTGSRSMNFFFNFFYFYFFNVVASVMLCV